MTKEEAIEVYNGLINNKIKEAFEFFAPELRESEDEKIRKDIITYLRNELNNVTQLTPRTNEFKRWIDYLEKQKEQKLSSDSSSSSEDVQIKKYAEKVESEIGSSHYSAKDCNNKQEWSEDKFPKDIEKDATQFCFDKGFNITPYQAKEIATHYLMIGHNFGYVEGRKNAHIPAKELGLPSSMDFKQEWSDEDEKMRRNLMSLLANMRGDRITEETYQKYYPWLKDLRSRPKPSDNWKPSEAQILAIVEALKYLPNNKDEWMILDTLIDVLKKLM